mmetsp:Transcript_8991/g.13518  ORF Transcript_8991/g.13518 Transcript_8991/m.13518 type:complete len:384 (-) Transcript_8991:101-1252(-)
MNRDNESGEPVCRFCFETEDSDNALVSPCMCSGTQAFVHIRCLRRWQTAVLYSSAASARSASTETRHLRCSTCDSEFVGVDPPTRAGLLENLCGEQITSLLRRGSFLVASRVSSERTIPPNIPRIISALFELKRAHWKHSAYFILEYREVEADGSGDEIIRAVNLTRPQSGSVQEPIPDEVLFEMQCEEQQPPDSRVTINHYNGGPVKWASYRSAMCCIEATEEEVTVVVDTIIAERSDSSVARPALFSGSPSYTLVTGAFSIVLDVCRHYRCSSSSSDAAKTLYSFSGYAEWRRAQLLGEIARGSWGLVPHNTALWTCATVLGYQPRNDTPDLVPPDLNSAENLWPSLIRISVESSSNPLRDEYERSAAVNNANNSASAARM